MDNLIWFGGGIFVGCMGMFLVMLWIMMSREYEDIQRAREEKQP